MNKITAPNYDDAQAFSDTSNNEKLGSYPQLKNILTDVHASYAHYISVGGEPAKITNIPLTDALGKLLKGHYSQPPANLAHITEMRNSTEHLICPMCGSMHSGTLDHYLPKNGFPIYALFSKNLVPACKCNSKRKEILMGASSNERILHPYFDDCLGERILRANFDDLGEVPRVTLALEVSSAHPSYHEICFHVNCIVEKSAIKKYIADKWSSMYRKPSLMIRAFEKNISTQVEVLEILEKERDVLDDVHRGKNNWNSVFVAGLLQPLVITWLTAQLSAPGRIPDSPLDRQIPIT